jgi:hypothetical protein
MRRLALAVLACAVLASAAMAAPRRCGDDVDGRGTAVPCDCGDVLVSSRALGDADPVTSHRCPGTGLVVDVPADRPGPTLRLDGHLIAGDGRGFGLEVVGGGRTGLQLVGPGEIRGFVDGVFARPTTLAAVEDVLVTDGVGDGFVVAGDGVVLQGCEASRNGHDGFALRGSGLRLDGNRAYYNRRYGFRIAGSGAQVGLGAANEASGNGSGGIVLLGRGHDVAGAVANTNGGDGIHSRAHAARIEGAVATGNARDGVHAAGGALVVSGSVGAQNGGAGIAVRGRRARDGGGNVAAGNGTGALGRPECRVGAACR